MRGTFSAAAMGGLRRRTRSFVALLIGASCAAACGGGEEPAVVEPAVVEAAPDVASVLRDAQAEAQRRGVDVLLCFDRFASTPNLEARVSDPYAAAELSKDFVSVHVDTGPSTFYRRLPPTVAVLRIIGLGGGHSGDSETGDTHSFHKSMDSFMSTFTLLDAAGRPYALHLVGDDVDVESLVADLRALREIRVRRDAAVARAAAASGAERIRELHAALAELDEYVVQRCYPEELEEIAAANAPRASRAWAGKQLSFRRIAVGTAAIADKLADHESSKFATDQQARADLFSLVASVDADPEAHQFVVTMLVQQALSTTLYESERQPLLDALAAAKALSPRSQFVPVLRYLEAMVRRHEYRR